MLRNLEILKKREGSAGTVYVNSLSDVKFALVERIVQGKVQSYFTKINSVATVVNGNI